MSQSSVGRLNTAFERVSLPTHSNGNCYVACDERWVGCRYEVH
jgi:hypothetical protein